MPKDGYLYPPDDAMNVSQEITGQKENKHEG